MPIARKKPPKPTLPEALAEDARLALYYAVVSQYHEQKYRDIKSAFFERVANCDDVTLVVGESLKFSDGLVRWQSRANPITDSDALVEAVHAGKLTIETLVALVKSWDAKAVSALFPSAVSEVKPCPGVNDEGCKGAECARCEGAGEVSTATEFGVMQANSEYKARVIRDIEANDARLAATAEPDLTGALTASLDRLGVEVKP
jgi:hypothetical protein